MSDTKTVHLLYPYTSREGKTYDGGKDASLPLQEAVDLIHLGRAEAKGSSTKAAEKSATNGGK